MIRTLRSSCGVLLVALVGCGPPLDLLPTELPDGAQGQSYSQSLTADGQPSFRWTIESGALPPGMGLDEWSGVLAGTPQAAGAFAFIVGVADGSFPPRTGSRSYSITILPQLVLNAALPVGRVGDAYSATLSAEGGVPPYQFSQVNLPAGLGLNPTTGVISGTPLDARVDWPVDIVVSDNGVPRQTAARTAVLVIKPLAVAITTTSLPAAEVGKAYSVTVQASHGMPPYHWSAVVPGFVGSLPRGLSLNTATGVISGTPAADAQTSTFAIGVTDSDSPATTATREFTIEVLR